MSTIAAVKEQPTPASVWQDMAGGPITDELLDWPPDLFALTDVILERSQAYRYGFAAPVEGEWPAGHFPWWQEAVVEAGQQWSVWVEDRKGGVPDLLGREWAVFREGVETTLKQLTEAHHRRMTEAVLTIHTIADEACAGLGVALDSSEGKGCAYRARGRELLARTGSMARIQPDVLRVLPKVRSIGGTTLRSLSRYACVLRPSVETRWHKHLGRRRGFDPRPQPANFLLLPWPLRVRESDFRPVEQSVQRLAEKPFGFFEFAPADRLDLDLMDRVLAAALDETDHVDAVVLPEGAAEEDDIADVEALLHHHDVSGLITGVRGRVDKPGQLNRSWVHIGVSLDGQWAHIRQYKHHRWSLDEDQIYQYHLGGVLHPHIRWWEATEVPRPSVQFVEVGEGITVVSLVCEDLAQNDDVADVLRCVGPTLVITPLLDGPQLPSRWAARYASALADDPGSAVLTLTSYGMARRSRPRGWDPSPVVAMWKDPARGVREIPLEPGAEGVLVTAVADVVSRLSADGRWPVENCTELFDVGVHQVRASTAGSRPASSRSSARALPLLAVAELTVLSSWAEMAAEGLAFAPDRVEALLADAQAGAPWRAELGIVEPSQQLRDAIDSIGQALQETIARQGAPTLDGLIVDLRENQPEGQGLDKLARQVLRLALEQRRTRLATQRHRRLG
jgi:hypothetical protein